MALVTTLATILKTYEYSETSKILRLLTRDHGLCSVIAKGARRPKSRFGGLLEPFTDGVATFYTREGRELHTLSVFDLRRERQALGRELMRYAGAGLLTEIALRFAPAAPDKELFDELGRGLDRLLEERGDLETAMLEETWKLIVHLGFAPNTERCSLCGRSVTTGERIQFDLLGGGIICGRCQRQARNLSLRELSSTALAELSVLVRGGRGDGRPLESAPAQRDLLRDFVACHLADYQQLNSFRFLEERFR